MKRCLTTILGALAIGTIFCSSAGAAVKFEFSELQRQEATLNRGDELVTYTLKLKNAGDTPTTGTPIVSLGLPPGAEFAGAKSGPAKAEGLSWTCTAPVSSCSPTEPIAAGESSPPLEMQVWIYPDLAPDEFTVDFTAWGGGAATHANASDTFIFGPALPFDLVGFAAAGCAAPPAAPGPGLCSSVFGSADDTVAGGHPFAAVNAFAVTTHRSAQQNRLAPVESLRDLNFELPAGFVGNPEAIPAICTASQVRDKKCPDAAAVGGVNLDLVEFVGEERLLYRIVPEDGYAAAFAFQPVYLSPTVVVLRAKLRSNGDYGVDAVSPLPPQTPALLRVESAALCAFGVSTGSNGFGPTFKGCKAAGDAGANPVPFITNPTRCTGAAPVLRAHADSYENPGLQTDEGTPDLTDPRWKSVEAPLPSLTECEALSEAWTGVAEPSFTFRPDSTRAAAPAGYSAQLHIPQDGLTETSGLATAHLKDTTVVLPEGIALNSAAADGLGACTLEQAGFVGSGFGSPNPMRFKTTSPGCPEDSKVGVAEVSTPILADPLPGAVYLAAQDRNPFGSKFAIYLVVDDPKTGTKVTLPGRVSPDPVTGRITTTFRYNPQAPIGDVDIDFFGGPRASLANPDVCATYTTQAQLTPWSAKDPEAPLPSETADPSDPVAIDVPPTGQASCPTSKSARPFAPTFAAGSTDPVAGGHSNFTVRITRPDGNQEIDQVTVTTPPGFAGVLKGVATCPDSAIDAARGRSGAAELANPSCPEASRLGSTTIGVGAGPSPFYVKTGKAYLTGPYKGAPLSMTFVVPAVAGPFDLGVQVVKTALQVAPVTAQITAVSDPIPQILEGVPVNVRDIRVEVDRPNFGLNPTSCNAMTVSGRIDGASGAVAEVSNRFQVGQCERLPFKPKLKLQLHGGTKRSEYQRLVATVTAKPGEANIARASVNFPSSIFLAQEHIRTICTRVQFGADQCPQGSIYGHATAVSPLLDETLSGPVYLRSSSNPLPDVVVALRGPESRPLEIELAGRVDSKNGGIRNTFELVPDAPVSKFTLTMRGGKKSLLVSSRNLCKGIQRATVRMTAQNGKDRDFRPVVGNDCGKKKPGKEGRKGRGTAKRSALSGAWGRGFWDPSFPGS